MSDTLDEKDMSLEIRKALRTEKAGYFSEVTKALIAVNSGGAITMLTVMGALAKEKTILDSFKLYGGIGFVCFAVGIVAALFGPIVLVDYVTAVREKKENPNRWILATAAIFGISVAALIIGLIAVTLGVFLAF